MSSRAIIVATALLLAGTAVLLWQTGRDTDLASTLQSAAPQGCSSCDARHRGRTRLRELLSGPAPRAEPASLPTR